MHKVYYASGFLYNPATQQILLQHLAQPHAQWSLFVGEITSPETPQLTLQRVLKTHLNITIPVDAIHVVYDYILDNKENHVMTYAELPETEQEIVTDEGSSWFSFKQLYKLGLNEQQRQDITIAQRVIQAHEREVEANNAPSQ